MMNKQRRRRGMTLAEIMICMAVVAISVVMVVSFSVTMGNRMSRSKAQLEARKELEAIESLTDAWLNAVLKEGAAFDYTLEVPETWPEAITATVAEQALTLNWQHNYLIGKLPGADAEGNPVSPITFRTEYVTGVQFYVKPGVKVEQVPVQKTDESGNPLFDENGDPVYETIEVRDGEGNLLREEIVTAPQELFDPDGDMLFYCKVTYEIPMANSKQDVELNHVFCINPHMGDKV